MQCIWTPHTLKWNADFGHIA